MTREAVTSFLWALVALCAFAGIWALTMWLAA